MDLIFLTFIILPIAFAIIIEATSCPKIIRPHAADAAPAEDENLILE